MKTLLIGLVLSLGLGFTPQANQQLDIYYMYQDEYGMYFLDPEAEYENVIFVEYYDTSRWGIPADIHHGTKLVGIFDKEGWELLGIQPN